MSDSLPHHPTEARWRRLGRSRKAGLLALLAGGVLAGLLSLAGCQRGPQPVSFLAEGKPAHLSDWHVLFSDGKQLQLSAGVVPYDLNTPLFTDYAHKLRTIWMPAGAQAVYHPTDTFSFPVGTIISKTFYYPLVAGQPAGSPQVLQTSSTQRDFAGEGLDLNQVRLIETRLLVRRESGWVALPYVWNADQTDADLARTGDNQALELVDESQHHQPFAYVVPNENQCAGCHVVDLKSKSFSPIGPKARHLNRPYAYASGTENQLQHLARLGYLKDLPTDGLPQAAVWNDASAPLEARARAYLDINCAHCHNPRGAASNTALRLDAFAAVDRSMGICKPPVAAGKGTGDRLFDIVPGQPEASIMPFRVGSTEGGVMMPELGRSTVHAEGLALLNEWIRQLDGRCETRQP